MLRRLLLLVSILLLLGLVGYAVYTVAVSYLRILSFSTSVPPDAAKTLIYTFFLRLTGILALVLIGITAVTGALRSFLISWYKSSKFWELHTKWTSSVGIGLVFAHLIIFLLREPRLGNSFLQSFVPTLDTVLANNNLVLLGLIALFTITLNTVITHIPGVTGQKWWRPLHILNYIALVLILTHALFIGSDSSQGSFKTLYLTLLVLTILGALYRFIKVLKKRTTKNPSVGPAPSGQLAGTTNISKTVPITSPMVPVVLELPLPPGVQVGGQNSVTLDIAIKNAPNPTLTISVAPSPKLQQTKENSQQASSEALKQPVPVPVEQNLDEKNSPVPPYNPIQPEAESLPDLGTPAQYLNQKVANGSDG